MPHQQHRHLHDRRDFGDDFDRWMDKMNPFKDNGGDNNGKAKKNQGTRPRRAIPSAALIQDAPGLARAC